MVERGTEERSHVKAGSGMRSPLLMPIMEGNTLQRDDVNEFLKCRLSLLRDWNPNLPKEKLS